MIGLYAVSFNGYMADGPDDDMKWTGKLDKKIFKLLTTISRDVVVSKNLYNMLPESVLKDDSRNFLLCDRNNVGKTLSKYDYWYRPKITIGGPRYIKACLDEKVLDTIIEVEIKNKIIFANSRYEKPDLLKYGFKKILTMEFDSKENDEDDIRINIYRTNRYGAK